MTNPTNIGRRTILKGGAIGTLYMAAGLPVLAVADFPKIEKAPLEFVQISSALLGIDASDLLRQVAPDNHSMADEYYSIIYHGCRSGLNKMIAKYRKVSRRLSPQQIGNLFLRADSSQPNAGIRQDEIGTAARLSMQMWLFGIWYGGTEMNHNPESISAIPKKYQNDFVLSSRAYKEGWIWRFAQSHPMGYSQLKFGHWAEPPPALQSYMPGTQLN
ncbi:MAG: hypothetical protein COA42_14380 [Alteromonadaceae bacterium]|nr:MAG: hypothetical protein COA42_14380 [Alteromonadaceae bacterium]